MRERAGELRGKTTRWQECCTAWSRLRPRLCDVVGDGFYLAV